MYIDGFSPELELEGCVAAAWAGRRAAGIMRGGCREGAVEPAASWQGCTGGKAGKWPCLSARLGNSTNVETVSLPSFDAVGLMGKIVLRAVQSSFTCFMVA